VGLLFCCKTTKIGAFREDPPMGGFHRAGTGKNKKVIEISPLLAFWLEKRNISLVRNGLFQILF